MGSQCHLQVSIPLACHKILTIVIPVGAISSEDLITLHTSLTSAPAFSNALDCYELTGSCSSDWLPELLLILLADLCTLHPACSHGSHRLGY